METQSIGNLKKVIDYIEKGNYNNAIQESFSVINKRPFHPEAFLQIIDLYLRVGDEASAMKYISKLITLTPKWDIARKLVSEFNIGNDYNSSKQYMISFCLIVKNEEVNIRRCLDSLIQIKNKEIIIVDTGSTDRTIDIAREYNVRLYEYNWTNNFAAARNESIKYAEGDWIFILDADEELAPNSCQTLNEDINRQNIIGYRLPLENLSSPLSGVNYVPRLFRNSPGLYFIGKIHETIYASLLVVGGQWNMEQDLGTTKILHHGYKQDEILRKNKIKRNLSLYEDALADLPDEPSIMMNYAHDLNHDGQTQKANQIFKKIFNILEQHKKEDITPEVREQFFHNYGVFLAQENQMEELVKIMYSRTARDTGPVANVHYLAALGLINCKRYAEAIRELELCVEKANDDSLAPSVPEIRSWRPKHLLANAHASIGDEDAAIRYWEEVLAECLNSPDPFHDYARYMSTLGKNKQAMVILIKAMEAGLNDQKIWELGAGIVNSAPELAEMALDWTEEAIIFFPESDVTNVRRGEALMKNGMYLEAIQFFDRLTSRGERTATAAQLICKKMMDQLSAEDLKKVEFVQNELKGWMEIMDKSSFPFNRSLAEELIR